MRVWHWLVTVILLALIILIGWRINGIDNILLSGKGLHPKVKQAMNKLIQTSENQGIDVRITEGYRSISEQNELYSQGRTKPGKIVTYAQGGESYHNYGLAIDFAIYDPERQLFLWDMTYDGNGNGKPDWMEVVSVAKQLGFAWGGDWIQFKDAPHLEMTFGYSIWELKFLAKIRGMLS